MKSFTLLNNAIDKIILEQTRTYFSEDGLEIQYKQLLHFINQVMIPTLQKKMNWSTFKYSKLRISDNNNNTDAAAFHRDLICYNIYEDVPIYTCLYYLDDGTMEIISEESNSNYMENWKKKERIQLTSGSLLVFKSYTIHRGVFNTKQRQPTHRRLIQLFECFGSEDDFDLYFPKILFIPAKSSNGNKIQSFQKNFAFLFSIANFITYMNALSGYNYKKVRRWLNQNNYAHIDFISSDAQQLRWKYDWHQDTQPTNLYIYPIGSHEDIDMQHHTILKKLQYNQPITYYGILLLLPILLGILLLLILIVCLTVNSSKK
jgi:hypothetical protein